MEYESASNQNEDNDPVVKEFDVFLNKSSIPANNPLYILQFPVRPNCNPCKYKDYLGGKVKPFVNKLELEIELDTRNDFYSRPKGEQFALNVDGKQQSQQQQTGGPQKQSKYYKSNVMDKQVYVSSNSTLNQSNKCYQLALVKNGEIHLTPVNTILQMRQNFEYFDIYEQKVKDLKEAQQQADEKEYSTEEEGEGEQEKAELVTMKYSVKTPKHIQQQQQMENEHKWLRINFDNNHDQANQKQMVSESREHFLECKNKLINLKMNCNESDLINRLITTPASTQSQTSAPSSSTEQQQQQPQQQLQPQQHQLLQKSEPQIQSQQPQQSHIVMNEPAALVQPVQAPPVQPEAEQQSVVVPKIEPKAEKIYYN